MTKKKSELSLSVPERIDLAKEKVERLVNRTLGVMRQRASNEIVLYSEAIGSQVPPSYAAHTFKSLKGVMFQHELVSLCALWDDARNEKEVIQRDSIPAVLNLIDHDEVWIALADEFRQAHLSGSIRHLNPSSEPEIEKLFQLELARYRTEFADEQVVKLRTWLGIAIEKGREIREGPLLKSVKHFRDTEIAHVLSRTAKEKTKPKREAKYGDEAALFDSTVQIVDWLNLGVNGSSFSWDQSREIEKRNAEAFWLGVSIEVIR